MAPAPGARDRRTNVQTTSNQYNGMGRKEGHFEKRTARVWPNAELSAGDKFTRENVVKQCGLSIEEDKFDWDNAIQKAEFSYAIAVMDRIGGWE